MTVDTPGVTKNDLVLEEFATGHGNHPTTNTWKLSFKPDGLYITDDAGTEIGPVGAAPNIQTLLDGISTTQGVILYYNGTDWAALATGTNGHFLKTQGAGANPVWAAAGLVAASQAEMEAATENGKAVTPLSANWHPGVAKFWIKFNGTGTIAIDVSHNVTSITDNGTGDYTVTIATDFSSANWAWVCTPFDIVGQFAGFPATGTTGAQAAGTIRFTCAKRADGAAYDPSAVYCAGFGDQA